MSETPNDRSPKDARRRLEEIREEFESQKAALKREQSAAIEGVLKVVDKKRITKIRKKIDEM